MGVTLRFLGSGDAFGDGGRLQTCMLLEGGDEPLMVDCGATSLTAMKRAGVDPSGIRYVLITHLHGDHFGGLPFLVLDGQFSRRTDDLVVAGPPGIGERTQAAMETFFPGSSQVTRRFDIEFVELAERAPARVGPADVTAYGVAHASGAPSSALRISYGGRVVAYSGDTEWTDALVEAADGADLFVCEGYSLDKKIKYHLDYVTLREQRTRLRCRRLILTHAGPEMLARRDEIAEEFAEDGLVVEV